MSMIPVSSDYQGAVARLDACLLEQDVRVQSLLEGALKEMKKTCEGFARENRELRAALVTAEGALREKDRLHTTQQDALNQRIRHLETELKKTKDKLIAIYRARGRTLAEYGDSIVAPPLKRWIEGIANPPDSRAYFSGVKLFEHYAIRGLDPLLKERAMREESSTLAAATARLDVLEGSWDAVVLSIAEARAKPADPRSHHFPIKYHNPLGFATDPDVARSLLKFIEKV